MGDKFCTVTEFTRLIKKNLTADPGLNNVWLKGEITNITYHSSGHIYFTLKDENAVISAVFFKYANRTLTFKLEDGMSVFAFGSVSLFEKRGSYQFTVAQVRLEGVGELQKRIEQLKKKLLAEGIFDPAHHKAIPFLPGRIGVVTSPTGAAFRDIIKVAKRRYPDVAILIAPALVQGDGAAESIACGIRELNNPDWGVDVIIAGRGGGSFEDLMAFNEEIVVRAFYNSRVPIISAVGHQVDHPLCDDAADIAAPTPSAAAEMAVPVKIELQDRIDYYRARAYTALLSYIREATMRLDGIANLRVFRTPREIIDIREMTLGDIESRITGSMRELISAKRRRLLTLPDVARLMRSYLMTKRHRYAVLLQNIQKLSPLATLQRGYAVARDASGSVVRSVTDVAVGGPMEVLLFDGSVSCTVNSTTDEVRFGKEKG